MAARPVELRVGGQSYRVVSSASAEDLERLAAMVDEKLTSLVCTEPDPDGCSQNGSACMEDADCCDPTATCNSATMTCGNVPE
jgi:hypothetical protein